MPETIQDVIRREAKAAGIPEAFALAVAEQESGFDPTVTGPEIEVGGQKTRAIGTFQLLPSTAQRLGVDPADHVQNIRGGVKYLRELLDRHQGDANKALAEYGGVKTNTTYVPGVLGRLPKFQAPTTPAAPGTTKLPPMAPVASHTRQQVATPPPSFKDRHPWIAAGLENFDPRTPTGQLNLAGGAGAMAAIALTAPVSVPAAIAAGVLGATGGGMLAASGQQIVGTAPPSGSAALAAGAEQGAYELAGHAFMWPIRAAGRRMVSAVAGSRAVKSFQAAVGTRPSAIKAGQAAFEVVKPSRGSAPAGPAQLARTAIGERVEASTKDGPLVDWAPVKAEIRRMVEAMQPSTLANEPEGAGFLKNAQAAMRISRTGGATAAEHQNYLNALRNAGVPLEDQHPLPGVLGKLGNAPDTVSFEDAHKFKRLLGDAINFGSPVKKQIQGITQATYGVVREAMQGHAPYDLATAEYEAIAPLFTKNLVPKIRKQALDAPEALIGQIRGDRPTAARQLQAVLVEQAEEGGGGPQGQAAWDSVRAAWTRAKLIRGKGGLPRLEERIDALDPEFVDVFYGDASGQVILKNLKQITAAYKASPLTRPGAGTVLPDVFRAGFQGPGSIFGAISLWRLLQGPSGAELVEYAAYQPALTQLLVRTLVGPEPGMAAAALVRAITPLGLLKDQGAQVGAPPPASGRGAPPPSSPSQVGAPPP